MPNLKTLIETSLEVQITSMPYGNGIVQTSDGREFFLKKGTPSRTFACEATGLQELAKAGGVNVPGVALRGENFILTDYIETKRPSTGFYTELGRMVAEMHRRTADKFGFDEDNFIGVNPQPNIPEGDEATDWAEFYYTKRLKYQLETAVGTGYFGKGVGDIMSRLGDASRRLLDGIVEPPALLHGDLWAGNYLCSADGLPYLIDPAVYYGHRETDLAMTLLFGGFPAEFYTSYDKAYPLPGDWRTRIPLYQLYHVLNHLNIFGSGYLRQAEDLIRTVTDG